MELKTAASVITAICDIESESADFYARCAERYTESRDWLTTLANENQKFTKRIKKAYYSAVTDALETNFSFSGLAQNLNVPNVSELSGQTELVQAAAEMEEIIESFYRRASDQTKGLMDDVSRVMARIAAARKQRIAELRARP
jgi:hypothetical protein